MRTWIVFALVTGLGVAAFVAEQSHAANEPAVDPFCECANSTIDTDEKAQMCGDMTDSMSSEEIGERTIACRQGLQPGADGIDVCYCLKSFSTDPTTVEICQALLPTDATPTQLHEMMMECANSG